VASTHESVTRNTHGLLKVAPAVGPWRTIEDIEAAFAASQTDQPTVGIQ